MVQIVAVFRHCQRIVRPVSVYNSLSTHAPPISSLRKITKPFLLKCHPDITPSATAKAINLAAIQNLNAYLDNIESIKRQQSSQQETVEIDFILQLETDLGKKRKSHRTTSSRRRVELRVPPVTAEPRRLYTFSRGELVKLLRVAGLSVPPEFLEQEREYSHDLLEEDEDMLDFDDSVDSKEGRRRPLTPYEKSRKKFMDNIQWQHYDRLYKQALEEMEADFVTTNLLQKYPGRRRTLISAILSRTRLQHEVGFAEQLIAFRRLSLLLEANFEELHLEEYGKLWESSCRFVLTPAREYSTSSTSLYKRRRMGYETGFSFVLHPNQNMSVHVPIDFGDMELIRELENNIWDFYNLVTAEDDLEELFPDPVPY